MASQCMWRALLARRTAWAETVLPRTNSARSLSGGDTAAGHSPNLRNASEMELPTSELPCKAKVVICGGGAQGTAIAYNLAKRGLANDTVIIDKGMPGGGTTWHSAGLIGTLKQSLVETKLVKISMEQYRELELKGFYTGWKQCGSLYLAQTKERMHYLKRMKSEAVIHNIACEVVGLDRISELSSMLRTDDLEGGLWVPGDGIANPLEVCLAFAILAAQAGVKIVPECEILEVLIQNGSVSGLRTNQGIIECEHFVNAAGYWARRIGTLSEKRIQVPLHAAEHYFLHTKPVAELPPSHPVVRDLDGHIYVRENEGRFLAGGFEPVAKPAFEDGMPVHLRTKEMAVDWDHFHVLLESLLNRVPAMADAVLEKLTNGPEPFSPDGHWVLGQVPEVRNYYVATAMRSIGVGSAGGVGEVIADYITKGCTPFDIHNLDIKRFLPMHNNRKFLRDRVKEVPGKLYAIPYPFSDFMTGRGLRTSPIFTKLKDFGARFNQVMGYERPMYFKKREDESSFTGLDSVVGSSETSCLTTATSTTFFKPTWFDQVKEEFVASRETASLCDFTSFAKMDVWSGGLEVVSFLQRLCSNDIDVPIGSIVHTGMQNEFGGYENDCTLARLAENHYFLMSPSIQQMRSFAWMKFHLPRDGSVQLQDVTSLYTTLCLMGPKSKHILARLTPLSLDTFPFFTIRHLDVGCAPNVLTMNVTHTGEQGYVFYIPNEFAVHVFDSIVEAGREFGLKQCGYYAMRALRIEKFYAFWGSDLDSQSTPLECGRTFRVKMNKDIPFIGRDALQEQLNCGIKKILVMLVFDPADHNFETDPWPWGGEPIFRDNRFCGHITTASYGFSLKRHVALGFMHNLNDQGVGDYITSDFVKSGNYEVEIAGIRYPVEVRLNPPVLPTRIRSEGGLYQATRHHASI